MRRMLGLATCILLRGVIGAVHRANDAADAGRKAKAQEQDHEPRLGPGLAVEPASEQQSDDDGDSELEADRGRRQGRVETLGLAGYLVDSLGTPLGHGASM